MNMIARLRAGFAFGLTILLASGLAKAAEPAAIPAATEASPTPAAASQPALGQISGRILPARAARAVKSINCLDRAANMNYAVKWDGSTGRLAVADLAPGRRYDLEVTAADGKTFIGVDLSYEEDRLVRLARETAGAGDSDPAGPLTDDDRTQIGQIVTKVDMFENQRRVVLLRGDHSQAAGLVELRRTAAFHSGKAGEQTCRHEIWYFKFQHGGWAKIANAEKILSRVRAPGEQIEKQLASRIYLAELGGILLDKTHPAATLDVTLPGYAEDRPASQPAAMP